MKIHKTCSSLTIAPFYSIIDTGDFKYLIKGNERGDKELKITKQQQQQLEDAFNEILKEYSERTANREVLRNYKAQIKIIALEFEYATVSKILMLFEKYEEIEILDLLNEMDYPFNKGKNIDDQIQTILKKLKGVKMRIKIETVKYKKRFVQEIKKVKRNLDKEALMLEMSLGLSAGSVDVYKTSVKRWVNMVKLHNEKQESHA